MSNKKICSCGTCETAMMRAAEFIAKMVDDDECASFAMAIGQSMTNLACYMLADVNGHKLEDKGVPQVIADMIAGEFVASVNDGIANKMEAYFTSNGAVHPAVDRLNASIAKAIDRRKAEANLPKD